MSEEAFGELVGPQPRIGLDRNELKRMLVSLLREQQQTNPGAPVSFPMCMGGWQNTNISNVTTSYVEMFRMNASGEPWPMAYAGMVIALATTITGGAIGGTSYEQQVYVNGNATGLVTSSAGSDVQKIAYLDVPVSPGDLITVREKRTGTVLNNRDTEAFVYVTLSGHQTPLATG